MKRREYLASHLGLVVRLGTPPAALALGGCLARGERVAIIEGATMGTAYRVSAVVDAGEVDALEDDVAAIVGQIDGRFATQVMKGEYGPWSRLVARGEMFRLGLDTMEKDFVFPFARAMPIDNQSFFYSDRRRWMDEVEQVGKAGD